MTVEDDPLAGNYDPQLFKAFEEELQPGSLGTAEAAAHDPGLSDQRETAADVEMSKPPHRWRKFLGRCALIGLVSVPGVAVGNMINPANTVIGPQKAKVSLTTDATRTVDFGVFDTITWPTNWAGLGVKIDVKGLKHNHLDDTSSNKIISNKTVQAYTNFIDDVSQKDRRRIEIDLLKHGGKWAVGLDSLLLFGFWLPGVERRRKFYNHLHLDSKVARTVIAASIVATSAVGVTTSAGSASPEKSNVNHAFDATPLSGATIHGELLNALVNKYAPKVIEYFKDNDRFFKRAQENLKNMFASANLLEPSDTTQLALVVEGLKCNTGMTKIIEKVIGQYKPAAYWNAGDGVVNIPGLDEACIKSEAQHTPHVDRVFAPGDHDAKDAQATYASHGFSVLQGKVIEKNGLRILGDSDPRMSVFGNEVLLSQDPVPTRKETVTEMGQRLARLACKDPKGVDVALVNEPHAALELVKSGCVKLAIAGTAGQHIISSESQPKQPGAPYVFVASASGAVQDKLTIGKPETTAEMMVIEFDKKTHRPLRYQSIRVLPNASVIIDEPAWLTTPAATNDNLIVRRRRAI
ncbi:MAG: metallophosphoesterase [Candidatus Saccharibacteria bacterium]|nr:metallophosphoesterase [Candidatus Saccharibacteria bacterium]